MTRDELEKRNVGENLDALMNLDPRLYRRAADDARRAGAV